MWSMNQPLSILERLTPWEIEYILSGNTLSNDSEHGGMDFSPVLKALEQL